jgi:hypothetical protein
MGAEHTKYQWEQAMASTNKVEKNRMREDIRNYGAEQKGEYKGIKWEMKRRYGTYWCGYVLYDGVVSRKCMEALEEASHGGLTAHLGFDCHHGYDFPSPLESDKAVFRDYAYVVSKLHAMIDCIVEELMEHQNN